MRQKTKKKDKSGDVIMRSVVFGVVSAVALLLIYSLLIEKDIVSIKYADAVVPAINLMAAAVCGLVSGKSEGEGRALRVVASCGILTLALAIFSLATNENGIEMSKVLRMILCGVGGVFVGVFARLGKSNKKLQKRGKAKRPNNK